VQRSGEIAEILGHRTLVAPSPARTKSRRSDNFARNPKANRKGLGSVAPVGEQQVPVAAASDRVVEVTAAFTTLRRAAAVVVKGCAIA